MQSVSRIETADRRFVVEIATHGGMCPGEWQFMSNFHTLAEAETFVGYHKELDEIPPVGKYSYRIRNRNDDQPEN